VCIRGNKMPADHYAIVIGLSRYPNLGDPPPSDLEGPEIDADAVVGWLTDANGGGLPAQNVKVIRSREYNAPPAAAPTRDQIEEAFLWLDRLAKDNAQAGNGRRVGTRLYLYASGHGFSPRFRQGCLLAGNAADQQFSANVFPSGWIDWFQDAEYFREYVLWMDCCMDRQVLTQPSPAPLSPLGGGGAPGPSFVAFAAPRPLKAAEKKIPEDGNRCHGIFTWNLLCGLRGAAANSFGMVTGRSLADWLRQAQLAWLDDSDRRSPDIAKEPSIIEEDDRLVFVRGVLPPAFDVTLDFPAAMTGMNARLWSGAPPKADQAFVVAAGGTKLSLKPGLYLAEVAGAGVRDGFTVTKSGRITLDEKGDPPVEASGTFQLTIDPGDLSADIRLIGDGFRSVDTGAGSLTLKLPFGLYQMRIQIGRQVVEKVILLDSDWPKPVKVLAADQLPALPEITSAAPLPFTRASHEYQQDAARQSLTRVDVTAGAGAELMVMARAFSESGNADPAARPWDGVAVLDASGKLVADLATTGQHASGGDPAGVCAVALSPGAYVLKYSLGSGNVAQSLIVPPGGWRLEAYLLRKLDAHQGATRPRITFLMRQLGAPWGTQEDLELAKATVALADERPMLNAELFDLLTKKFQNPLAGILGGHLLLLGHEDRPPEALNEVVRNLQQLVGLEHPDVQALSLACSDASLRKRTPVSAAPMFERSWRMLTKASQKDPQLVPLALWQQVHAAFSASPPFLSWSLDASVQRAFRHALAEAAFGRQTLHKGEARSATNRSAESDPISFGLELPAGPTSQTLSADALGLPPAALAALRTEYD
jgi:hypothetical protein